MVAKHSLLYASYEKTKILKICIVLFIKTGVLKISRASWQSNTMCFSGSVLEFNMICDLLMGLLSQRNYSV